MAERPKEYKINDEGIVGPSFQKGVFQCCIGCELIHFLLAPLAWSRHSFFSMNNTINI